MKRIITILVFALVFSSCKKEAGEGGINCPYEDGYTEAIDCYPKIGFIPLYLEYARPLTEARDQFHLASALSVLSAAYERRIFIEEGSRIHPNLYTAILGHSSASKKSTSIKLGLDLMEDVFPERLSLSNSFTPEGLQSAFGECPLQLIEIDELGGFLAERVYSETDGYHTPQSGRIGTEMGEFIFFNSQDLGAETSFAEYKAKSEARKNQFLAAKKLSWVYPGMGHMALDQKGKGITLLAIETISLAMAFISLNNMGTTNDALTASKQAYNNWAPADGSTEYDLREAKYLSDNDANKSASMQFYGSAISSLAVWAYNIYDINKKRYNYTDNQKNSIFDISFRPDNQIVFHIKF